MLHHAARICCGLSGVCVRVRACVFRHMLGVRVCVCVRVCLRAMCDAQMLCASMRPIGALAFHIYASQDAPPVFDEHAPVRTHIHTQTLGCRFARTRFEEHAHAFSITHHTVSLDM